MPYRSPFDLIELAGEGSPRPGIGGRQSNNWGNVGRLWRQSGHPRQTAYKSTVGRARFFIQKEIRARGAVGGSKHRHPAPIDRDGGS